MKRAVLVLVLVVLVAAGLAGYRQFVLLPAARAPVFESLNDPHSAQFEGERYVGPWSLDHSIYCGRVNAKNATGGYTGFREFVVLTNDGYGIAEFNPRAVAAACADPTGLAPWWWLRM